MAKIIKTPEPKKLEDMTPAELVAQKNRIENALAEPEAILDPSQRVDALMYIRDIDFELMKRDSQMPISEFSTITLEHLIEQNGEDELFHDTIQKSVMHDELLKRNK